MSLGCDIVILNVIAQLHVYKVLGRITWGWADWLRRIIMRIAAVQEEERRDWHSFLANSDDEQDRVKPANGSSTSPYDHIEAMQAELEAYPCPSKLASDKSVNWLMWWSVSVATYPVLSAVAPCFLSMVVIIVPWERLFNTSGIIVNDLRSALSPQSVNARHAPSLNGSSSLLHAAVEMMLRNWLGLLT